MSCADAEPAGQNLVAVVIEHALINEAHAPLDGC
jgi:hypothetical protein